MFKSDFTKGTEGWTLLGGGDWTVQDGVLRQTAEKTLVRALAGDKSWTDYTLTLKARKLSGAEGFQIMFHIANDDDRMWWNIGGWNNTQDAIEVDSALDSKPGHVETDRWYDIKLTVVGKRIQCWLDGQLVHDTDYATNGQYDTVYATSAVDNKTGDIIVKVVNTAAEPVDTELNLIKANLTGKGTAMVLTSENPEDENSLAEPTKVSPKSEAIRFTDTKLKRSFPGNSLTVLRLQTSK